MITYKEVDFGYLDEYDKIPMRVEISKIYHVNKCGKGLGGIQYSFEEKKVEPYVYDFTNKDSATGWKKDFKNWAIFMAFDDEKPIGGTVIAAKTPEIRMLDGREDITVLWDLRVDDRYKHIGIGHNLMTMAINWSRDNGYKQMKIECQNTNIPACRFYEKHGAELCVINENAYGTDEVMFLWYLNLALS